MYAMTKGRTLALVIGLVYTALAVAGLIAVQTAPSGRSPSDMFAGFGVSPLLTIFHAAAGLAGLLAVIVGRPVVVRIYGVALAVGFIGLTAYALPAAIAGDPGDVLNIGWFNVGLYAVTTLVGLFLAYGKPIRREAPVSMDAESPT